MRELLPILVADLAEASARDALLEIARRGGEAWVPLVAAPTERARHLLEVYTPDGAEALRLIAEPLGPPGERGFPLRLHLFEAAPSRDDDDTIADASPPVAAAILGADGLVGRALAGGKLVIESSIGSGAVGTVYRARHRDLQIPVAVKVLDESFQHDAELCERFQAEALAASRLDHPNLVRVFDYGQEADGLLYFSMELLEGITLRSLLARGATLSLSRIVEIGAQVCAGLAHAHARGILHRRVAPENVMLVPAHDDEGRLTELVKVCDFGLALGASGSARGTPEYMAPEQCRGEDLDERADVYGCGILLFELATGRVPFSADKPIVVVNRQLSMPPPPIAEERPDLDPRLERVVHKALEKSRDRRHASMRELRAELKALLGPVEPIAVASIAPPPASRQPEWLEERSAGYARFLGGMASTPPPAPDVAEVLAHDPSPWLSRLVAERDPRAFAQQIADLDRAVRVLAHRADAKALWAVSSALHGLASEASGRGEAASKVLDLFADPGMLGPLAERLLAHDDDAREAARTLVVRARAAGAYALYGARVKHAADPRVRTPFVETMQMLGEHGWPVVRAALERIPTTALTGEHPPAADLAEDLLSCVPAIRDEAAGHLVATYVRATVPPLCRAAARALARLWAEGARPLLLDLLAHGDEGACMAAIAGLREIGAVDPHVATHLAPLVAPGARTSGELRLSALAALGAMTADARPIAVPALVKVVRDPAAPDAATVLAAARALVAVMGREAMAVIHERADASPEPLRSELRALGRSLPPI